MVAVIAVNANGLRGVFLYDDEIYIVENPAIRQLWPPIWAQDTMAHRPVAAFTLALNYAVGGLDVTGYHVVNILIHVLCAITVLAVLRRTPGWPAHTRAQTAWTPNVALSVALLWALHPLTSECVNYLSQRTDSLMGLFCLLMLYCAIRRFEGGTARWGIAAVVCCALGMGCKESMVGAPLIVLLYDRAFFPCSFFAALRRRPWLYGGLSATWLLVVRGLWAVPHGATVGLDLRVTPWEYTLNQSQMLCTYLGRSLWPHPLVLDYGFVRDLSLAEVWLEVSVIVALLALTGVALWRWPSWGFVGAWFFVLLAPTSSFVPILTEVGAERRMYLPLLSVVVILVMAGRALLRHRRGRFVIVLFVGAGLDDVGAQSRLP